MLFIDAIHYSVRDNGVIRKLAAYVILGINLEGRKEVLTIEVGQNESAKYWLSVLNGLKNRGVKDILIICADGLTGIPNRSRLEKFINTIEERGEDYCIVSIDLNELKPVNDKQGHLMGDKYLLEFSDILQSCFTGKGFIARIGGDV